MGLAALAVVAATPSLADTRSQQLFVKALIPFQAQRWQDAQTLLTKALEADPDDALAAYYRGLAAARLGNTADAIRDIERALALKPDLSAALLDLGILYFNSAQYPAAQEWLQRAYQQPATRFPAALYLGLTHLRLGDPAAALPYLREAQKDPALRQTGQYYEAIAQLREGDRNAARTLFQQVESGPSDAQTTQIAQQYLAGGSSTAPGAAAEKPWSVHANAGFGYDSNNGLVPSSSAAQVGLDTDGETDGFFRVGAGASYTLADSDVGSARMGYNLYQSVHFSTPRFDLQSHRLDLTLATPLYGFWQAGVAGIYDFYLLDYQSFYQGGRGTPFVNFFQGDVGATQIYYTFGGQDFFRGPFNPFRDSYINRAGVRQSFLLGAADRSLTLGYTWDDFDPLSRDGTDFAYMDNMFDVQLDFGLFDVVDAQLSYLFDLQDYEHPNSRVDYRKRRHDQQSQFVVHLSHAFNEMFAADLAYLGILNDSNIDDFEYDRSIIQANVWLHF